MSENSIGVVMNTLIADDEPIARRGMQRLVQQVPFLNLVGTARNFWEVSNYLDHTKVDLLFLDIQMPGITGVEYIKILKKPPLLIFATAFSEYAMEGYELDALDYLLKPITLQRFFKAANKAKEYFELRNDVLPRHKMQAEKNHIFIKENKQLKKIYFGDILFIEAMLNYVIIHTVRQRIITYLSLKSILERLPPSGFLKIHKSYIISIDKIRSAGKNSTEIDGHLLPVSRAHKEELKKFMPI
jgi:two-component system LytT family response regulator